MLFAGLGILPIGKTKNDLIQKTIELDRKYILDSGTSIVQKNQTRVYVKSQSVKSNSKITVTFTADYTPAARYWVAQRTSYEGFYLELPALQRGLMWGIGRLAQVRPELLRTWQAPRHLLPYLASEDHIVRALAARALGLLGASEAGPAIAGLLPETASFPLYTDGRLSPVSAASLGREALAALSTSP